jgi:pimeloyl-ACP methyl ester carboxylesterase
MDPGYLRELVTYWSTEFDWRARERELNAVPQFSTRIDGQDVHFLHVRSGNPAALPIVLTHGWPSSFLEMLPLVGLLTDPARHGAEAADAFHVIVPSLPGFAFSGLPPAGPVTPPSIAALWVRLMRDVLGYPRFGAYGGDIGAHVTGFLGAQYPDQVIGMYTHHPSLHPDLTLGPPPSAAEQRYLAERNAGGQSDHSYGAVQSRQPDTLAAALLDSPAGLAAWIVEKYRSWADCNGDIESRFTKDTLLTIITLYWATSTIGTSFRSYYDDAQAPPLPVVTVPTGITLTPEDKNYPREYAARTYHDIRQWHGAHNGGHFFAMEEPTVLAERLRSFFRPLRQAPTPR